MTKHSCKPEEGSVNIFYRWFILISTVLPYLCKKYKNKITKKVFNKQEQNPWMRYKEILIVKELLTKYKPKNFLEWGAGYSTLYFPGLLSKDMKWISVEHDKDWAMKIKKQNQRSNVRIYHCGPDHFPWTDYHNDGAYYYLKDYVDFPEKFGKFDCILVDGRARNQCLKKAFELINKNGIVILHDANRIYYHEPFKLFKFQTLFEDHRDDAGGIWIGSKNSQIESVLDVKKYNTLWHLIDKYSDKTLGRGWAKEI